MQHRVPLLTQAWAYTRGCHGLACALARALQVGCEIKSGQAAGWLGLEGRAATHPERERGVVVNECGRS